MGCIYKITNNINGKLYIGKTIYDLKTRFKQHLEKVNDEKIQYPLYRAMRKYGIDNFSIEEIETIDNEDILNKREKYWINYYDTYIKNNKGYNCTLGGEGNALIDNKQVYDLWDQGLSIQQISKKLGNDRGSIRKILKQYNNYNKEESEKRGDMIQGRNNHKSIVQYDIKGNYINTFCNMYEAERQTGISSKSIYLGVHLQQKVVGGFQWRFLDDKNNLVTDLSKEKIIIYKQQVNQIDTITNEKIKTYSSVAEASRKTGISDISIRKVCNHNGFTAGGFKWEYDLGGDYSNEHQE